MKLSLIKMLACEPMPALWTPKLDAINLFKDASGLQLRHANITCFAVQVGVLARGQPFCVWARQQSLIRLRPTECRWVNLYIRFELSHLQPS